MPKYSKNDTILVQYPYLDSLRYLSQRCFSPLRGSVSLAQPLSTTRSANVEKRNDKGDRIVSRLGMLTDLIFQAAISP